MPNPNSDLYENYMRIQERIAEACAKSGRKSSEVTLVAVTKSVLPSDILELYDLGQRDFGESRLQEALPKIESLPTDIDWHFIGRLQSNKAKRIGNCFSAIHTLESTSQLAELDKIDRSLDVCIEVNIARETQKGGIFPEVLDEFVSSVLNSNKLRLRGLMTIGPFDASQDDKRRIFRDLRALAARLPNWQWLSMGMSDDFEVAIQEGSTHVRVGSALFGERAN